MAINSPFSVSQTSLSGVGGGATPASSNKLATTLAKPAAKKKKKAAKPRKGPHYGPTDYMRGSVRPSNGTYYASSTDSRTADSSTTTGEHLENYKDLLISDLRNSREALGSAQDALVSGIQTTDSNRAAAGREYDNLNLAQPGPGGTATRANLETARQGDRDWATQQENKYVDAQRADEERDRRYAFSSFGNSVDQLGLSGGGIGGRTDARHAGDAPLEYWQGMLQNIDAEIGKLTAGTPNPRAFYGPGGGPSPVAPKSPEDQRRLQELVGLKRQGEQLLSRYKPMEEMETRWRAQFQGTQLPAQQKKRDAARAASTTAGPDSTSRTTQPGQGTAATGDTSTDDMQRRIREATTDSMDGIRQEITATQSAHEALRQEVLGDMHSDSSKEVERAIQGIDAEYERQAQEVLAGKGSPESKRAKLSQLRYATNSQKYTMSQNMATDFVNKRTEVNTAFAQMVNQFAGQALGAVGQIATTALTSHSFAAQTGAKLAAQLGMFGQELTMNYQKLALNKTQAKQANLLAYDQLRASQMPGLADLLGQYIPEAPIYGQIFTLLAQAQQAASMA